MAVVLGLLNGHAEKPRKKQVRWSEQERQQVIEGTVQHRLLNPGSTLDECFKLAQQSHLEPGRENSQHVSQSVWLMDGVAARLAEIKKLAEDADPCRLETIRQDYERRLRSTETQLAQARAEAELTAEIATEEALSKVPVTRLCALLFDRFTKKQEALEAAVVGMAEALDRLAEGGTGKSKANGAKLLSQKITVLFCGGLSDNNAHLKRLLPQATWLNLVFVPMDKVGTLPACDVAVLWARHVNYALRDHFLKQLGKERVLVVDGKKSIEQVAEAMAERLEFVRCLLKHG